VTEVTKCLPCPPDPCERIVQAIAIEQEQLARILTSLADKAEKAANWLPDTAPDEPFNVIVDKVRALECVMAQEIGALAMKEKAMRGLLRQCVRDQNEVPSPCLCPCALFHVCKITKRCPVSCHMDLDLD
jgi:hypothetical protein